MSKRILVIEDNPENRMLMRRVLMAEGYLMEEAVDGQSGLQIAAESPPDLILMDINLPGIDGYEVTARLKQLPNMLGVPIIAVTANVMKGDRERPWRWPRRLHSETDRY
jgi:two-component system cell cycle response regulator DivK